MKVIIHNRIEALNEIMPEWKKVTNDFYEITIFQNVEWMRNWWEHKKKSKEITAYIVQIKEENETIGVIPLYLSDKEFANIKFRILRPIGVAHSDYLLPILSKKYMPEHLLKIAIEKIYADKDNWDCIHWGDVPEDSIFDLYLNKQKKEKKHKYIKRKKAFYSPRVKLNKDIKLVESRMSKSFLKSIRYKKRKLKREGDLVYHRVTKEEDIEPIMNKHFKYHFERWKLMDTKSSFE